MQAFGQEPAAPPVLTTIVEQHAEEAAFLWHLRDIATTQPHFRPHNLRDLEERIEAHLDGLRVAGDTGLQIAWDQLQRHGGPGELFTVGTLALERPSDSDIEAVLAFAEHAPESWRGLFASVGWVSPDQLRGRAVAWLDADVAFRRLLGVVACSLHRVDPGSRLVSLLDEQHLVRRRALRLAGELGRIDLRQQVRPWLLADDDACRFWAAWAAGLLGNRADTIRVLQTFAIGDSRWKWRALDLVIRLMNQETAVTWLQGLTGDPVHERLVLVGAGVLGDPAIVPWLIRRMNDPALARVAGESFCMITGADLAADTLERPEPMVFPVGPTDEPSDEDVAIDPDENLSWPDATKVQEWWQGEEHRFVSAVRFLAGSPIAPDCCHEVLRSGYQRQRAAAAYELALMNRGHRLWNWRARLSNQVVVLG